MYHIEVWVPVIWDSENDGGVFRADVPVNHPEIFGCAVLDTLPSDKDPAKQWRIKDGRYVSVVEDSEPHLGDPLVTHVKVRVTLSDNVDRDKVEKIIPNIVDEKDVSSRDKAMIAMAMNPRDKDTVANALDTAQDNETKLDVLDQAGFRYLAASLAAEIVNEKNLAIELRGG